VFIRVSILEVDPARIADVERLWLHESLPHARSQEGNLGAKAFRSVENPGQIILVGEWASVEEADAYLRSPEHDELVVKYGALIRGISQRFVGELIH